MVKASFIRFAVQTPSVVVILIAGVLGVSRLDFKGATTEEGNQPDGPPGSGIVVRAEVEKIWLPQGLVELAKPEGEAPAFRSHEEMRVLLDRLGQGSAWYAMAVSYVQANGVVTRITYIRRPREESDHFKEFLNVLATAATRPPVNPDFDYSEAEIVVVPVEKSTVDPLEVISKPTSRAESGARDIKSSD